MDPIGFLLSEKCRKRSERQRGRPINEVHVGYYLSEALVAVAAFQLLTRATPLYNVQGRSRNLLIDDVRFHIFESILGTV
jgi:hypothetical protein